MEEVDYELSALCDTVMLTCACGTIDLYGEPLYDYFGDHKEVVGIICRKCWSEMLCNWVSLK